MKFLTRYGTRKEEAIRVARQLFAEGKTVSEVARMMCLSESRVRKLKKAMDEN